MDISKVIISRKSIRSFKHDPVPKDVLYEIMEEALRSPSWANIQPWEFAIAGGSKLTEIRRRFIEMKGTDVNPDIPQFFNLPEPYNSRSRATIAKSHESVGIKRGDKEKRDWWELQQLTNFGAPSEIYVYIDRALYQQKGNVNIWPIFDCGVIAGTITLLATNHHLGTIIQARAVVYPDIIREVLRISNTKLMLIGIGIGYPDFENPVNQYTTEREPIDNLVSWHDFEGIM